MKVQVFECLRCGKEWTRKPVRGQRPKFCPECRAESRGHGWRGPYACETCQSEFWVPTSRSGGGRFCSRECWHAAPQPKERPREWHGHVIKGGAWVQGPCPECGVAFTRPRGATYCTDRCRSRARERRRAEARGEFIISRRERLAIYERDEWTCQICGLEVDTNLHYLDDGAATLDHIIPQSAGGTHEPKNLRLAHRICNAYRNADLISDEEVAALTRARLTADCPA